MRSERMMRLCFRALMMQALKEAAWVLSIGSSP